MEDEERAATTGKNIVVLSDGTGQEGGEGNNSNVYKMFQMIEDRTNAQIAFYDPGLGTGWRKFSGNAMGAGISQNVLDCYGFISDNYKWGDRIFLFGFSRGATTVRSLSGFIARFGILPHSRPELARKAWKIYTISDDDRRNAKAKSFISRNTTTWCNIDFVGVWDTVSALGVPYPGVNAILDRIPGLRHSFHDLKLSASVRHAYHAMSIDENRRDFAVTPWHTEHNGESLLREVYVDPRDGDSGEQTDRTQTVDQVWFSGVHTDVGGGYAESGLSDISLAWMIDRAVDADVLDQPLRLFPYSSVVLDQKVDDRMHDERGTWLKERLFREGGRSWDRSKCGKPVVHASVLERETGIDDRPYRPWILEEFGPDEYEIAAWDNKGSFYNIPIEVDYRMGSDT